MEQAFLEGDTSELLRDESISEDTVLHPLICTSPTLTALPSSLDPKMQLLTFLATVAVAICDGFDGAIYRIIALDLPVGGSHLF